MSSETSTSSNGRGIPAYPWLCIDLKVVDSKQGVLCGGWIVPVGSCEGGFVRNPATDGFAIDVDEGLRKEARLHVEPDNIGDFSTRRCI